MAGEVRKNRTFAQVKACIRAVWETVGRRNRRRTPRPPGGARPGSGLADIGNDRRVSARRNSGSGTSARSPHVSSSQAVIIAKGDETDVPSVERTSPAEYEHVSRAHAEHLLAFPINRFCR
jgi:hypothetical protein